GPRRTAHSPRRRQAAAALRQRGDRLMRQDDQVPGPVSAGLASSTRDDGGIAPAEDERIAQTLGARLGRLRKARNGLQGQLQRALLDRLAEPPRPWWRRIGASRRQARRVSPGVARLPRRSLFGLAAATAVALTAASLSLPLVGPPEVSAREILEKV